MCGHALWQLFGSSFTSFHTVSIFFSVFYKISFFFVILAPGERKSFAINH